MSSVEEMLALIVKQAKDLNSKLDATHCEMMSQMKELGNDLHRAFLGEEKLEVNVEAPTKVEEEVLIPKESSPNEEEPEGEDQQGDCVDLVERVEDEEKEVVEKQVMATNEENELVPKGEEPKNESQQESDVYRVGSIEEKFTFIPKESVEAFEVHEEISKPDHTRWNVLEGCSFTGSRILVTKISRYKEIVVRRLEIPSPYRRREFELERLMAQPFEGGGNDMESMSWAFMVSMSKNDHTTRPIIYKIQHGVG